MEAQRQRVADLLAVEMLVKDIIDIVKCSRSLVDKVKRLQKDGKGFSKKVGSNGHIVLTEDFLTGVASEIKANREHSMREMAKNLNMGVTTIRKAVVQLGAHMRRRHQLLTKATRESRVSRGKKIINWMKSKALSTILVFSDKRNRTVDQAWNARNDRYLAYNIDEVLASIKPGLLSD